MVDKFADYADEVSAPARAAVAVTPSNTTPLTDVPKALYVGTGGHVTCRGPKDAVDVTFMNVPSGSIIPMRAVWIKATGTTAADILALY